VRLYSRLVLAETCEAPACRGKAVPAPHLWRVPGGLVRACCVDHARQADADLTEATERKGPR
jgi:hypothetical protein